VQNTML